MRDLRNAHAVVVRIWRELCEDNVLCRALMLECENGRVPVRIIPVRKQDGENALPAQVGIDVGCDRNAFCSCGFQ